MTATPERIAELGAPGLEPWALLADACRRAIDGLALKNDPALHVQVNPADMPKNAKAGAVMGVSLVTSHYQEVGYVRAFGVHWRFQERIHCDSEPGEPGSCPK